MNVIGFSTGSVGRNGNVDRMVQAVLAGTDGDTEFAKLTDLSYSGCKGCADRCAGKKVCTLNDDLESWYPKIKDADAIVIGSPTYFGTINAAMIAFLERFYGYRHVRNTIQGKPVVLVIAGCGFLERAEESFRERLAPFEPNILHTVQFVSRVFPCYVCGYHQRCRMGGLYHTIGEDAHELEITPGLFHAWEDDAETSAAITTAVEKLKHI
jgi:hypothetical protein